jgi:C4-dicarboxylate transporter DctQ subunit
VKILNSITNGLTKIEGWICLVALGIMFLVGALEVLSRNLVGKSFYWAQELIIIMLVWEVFIGAAYIFNTSHLISVDILYEKLGERGKKVLDIINDIVIMIIALIVLRFGWKYMLMQGNLTTTALHVPQSIYTIPMIISFASMMIVIIRRFIKRMLKVQTKEES